MVEIDKAKVLEVHGCYLQMFDWSIDIKRKVRMFGDLVIHANPDTWRVIGVTSDALEVFAQHGYRKESRMGVNRGHLVNRNETYTHLYKNRFEDPWEFWAYYYDRDSTVLMTASENMSGEYSKMLDIPQELGLFHTQGYAWKHGKKEEQFLRELHLAK